jgi:FKBP-type peptidyl-prolyl cis-trans isomerase FkpA
MKKNLIFLALVSLGLASCNGGFKQDEGGLLYDIHVDKGGPTIQAGDFVSANVIAKTDGDSVLFSTYESGHPIETVILKPQYKGDIFTALEKLSEGDSATIKLNADTMYKKQPKPPGFKGKYIVYEIKIEKVIAKGTLSDAVFQGRVADYAKSQAEVLKKQEPILIKKYIADNKLNVTETADSLYYVINTPGSGPKPAVGDTAVVNYVGRFVSNGKVFDTSIKDVGYKAKIQGYNMRDYKPIHIPVGEKRVIPGWDEGLQLLSKGAKATLLIPSSLAYGEHGMQQFIGPYTPIVFEIEMVDIIHPNPNAPKPVMPSMMPPPTAQRPVTK